MDAMLRKAAVPASGRIMQIQICGQKWSGPGLHTSFSWLTLKAQPHVVQFT